MVRKTKPDAWARQESKLCVQFHCYDIVDKAKTFEDRNEWIESNLQESYCIDLVSTSKITAEPAAKMTHKINLASES